MAERQTVQVGERELSVSNLDKVLYPETGTTKAEVIRYYLGVAEVMLPHLRGRPVTLKRWPDGVDGEAFFEKRCPSHRPEWLGTVTLGREGRDKVVDHCDLAETAALAWTSNLAALELHVPMGRAPDPAVPTAVVFDLDPGAPADVLDCARLALRLRTVLDRLGLVSVPKTSGGKGLQIYVPVNRDDTGYEATRAFSLAVGRLLERDQPDRVVTVQDRKLRGGKVLVDWSQNHLTKTTICAYSLRGRARPTVSTPLTWDEVSDGADAEDAAQLVFEAPELGERISTHGDLFAAVAEVEQQLPKLG